MRRNLSHACIYLALFVLALTACGAPTAAPEPDRVATRVAEEQAVAATLTAAAQPVEPTKPPLSLADTPRPTPPPSTDTPTRDINPIVPVLSPTPEPPRDIDPVVPGFGDPRGLAGEIVLPGYPLPVPETPIFDKAVVFHLRVHDPDFGVDNGAGIVSVDITITDPNGEVVQENTEQNPKYCAFGGGEPDCNVWGFAENGNTWPKGQPIIPGFYSVGMIVHTQNPDKDQAFWGFTFEVQLP